MLERPHLQPRDQSRPSEPDDQADRWELLGHLQRLLDPVMVVLGVAFLALLVADFADLVQSPVQRVWIDRGLTTIWVIFVLDFLLRLVVAPSKLAYLRANWLSAASLVLPFLRPIRALRAIRAVRSLSLVRLLGGANRGMRVLQRITAGRTLAYVGALTILATMLGAVGVLFFDRAAEDATIRTMSDALWWSAAMVTTINNEKYAVTAEGRIVAILLRVFAVSVFGFITASIASFLIGKQAAEPLSPAGNDTQLAEQVAAFRREQDILRREIAALREVIERRTLDQRPSGWDGEQHHPARPSQEDRVLAQAAVLPRDDPEEPPHER